MTVETIDASPHHIHVVQKISGRLTKRGAAQRVCSIENNDGVDADRVPMSSCERERDITLLSLSIFS
jgi:hypothetical protein